ncbi:MAG: hypothetical protein AAF570_20730 [Bacteroidota bacterium]
MRDLGEFVSVFKRALRDQFDYQRIEINQILLITDLSPTDLPAYTEEVQTYLDPEFERNSYTLSTIGKEDWSNWADMRAQLDDLKPDLVVTYRLLRVAHTEILTSLGVYVDSLTQVTPYPVLLMPNPHMPGHESAPQQLGVVVVATEHMYTDHSLVNYGIRFTPRNNELFLCHVDDGDTFEYYMKAIEKIPELDNDIAREKLEEQLNVMPKHYAESVQREIEAHKKEVKLCSIVEIGHIIDRYRALIAKEPVSLLAFTTKDDTQLAMHSLGYSLAVEFRNMPILLI